jgi:hypothetical protein
VCSNATIPQYKQTGNKFELHSRLRILRWSFTDRYKRLQFRTASHLAQSVGPGAPSVSLGEGAKSGAPLLHQATVLTAFRLSAK